MIFNLNPINRMFQKNLFNKTYLQWKSKTRVTSYELRGSNPRIAS